MLILFFAFLNYTTLISFPNETPVRSIKVSWVNDSKGAIAGLNCAE